MIAASHPHPFYFDMLAVGAIAALLETGCSFPQRSSLGNTSLIYDGPNTEQLSYATQIPRVGCLDDSPDPAGSCL